MDFLKRAASEEYIKQNVLPFVLQQPEELIMKQTESTDMSHTTSIRYIGPFI